MLHGALSGKELSGSTFQADVLNDSRVWIVEFYSAMCGGCQEFAPTWERVDMNMKSIVAGKVNIDEPEGEALAKSLGVLDEGVPSIRLFMASGDSKGVSIMQGQELYTAKQIMSSVRTNVLGLKKREDGYMVKKSKHKKI